LPILVFIADIIGVFGGFMVGSYKLRFNATAYIQRTADFLQTNDVTAGLVKAGVFGFVVALMGCYFGYNSRGGAQGVGAATTYAVVSASILILLLDYVLTALLFVGPLLVVIRQLWGQRSPDRPWWKPEPASAGAWPTAKATSGPGKELSPLRSMTSTPPFCTYWELITND